ncbi:DnaD domain protein [Lysinibacillus sp. ZYM-1]|uniref:DnaD domain protein n=1 Tax=Lysinibacillus sp. ZYM-1 TaxID=1681184 RepID=UPI0006CE6D6D|nr:DnaD domain protein [Lysinibacillus sp. ZYM-1]KPN96358.1 replication protein [Lysinibacillus sp. ZYM-1]
MIYRVTKHENFVVLDKAFLNDDQLSWKAKGLLAYMLSLPDDWDFCLADLTTRSKCGREATSKVVDELIQAGYLQKVQERTKDGKFGKVEFFVFEASKRAVLPSTGFPSTATPQTEKPTLLNNQLLNNQLLKNRDDDNKPLTAYHFYEQQGFGSQSAYITAKIRSWLGIFSEEMVLHAMKLAVEHNVLRWRYVEKILLNWHRKKLKNMADIASDQLHFKAQKQKVTQSLASRRQEIIPKWFHHRHEEERPFEQQPTINFEEERQKILALLESI